MRAFLSASLLAISCSLFGQIYHFPETIKYFSKSTDFGTVHGYLPIVNDTGDSVLMRWVSRRDPMCPSIWNFNFDDQNNFYGTVSHLDSAEFYLKPPDAFDQKMIIGLTHNDSAGFGSIFFTIFPVQHPDDSTVIEFNFSIVQGTNPGDTTDTNVVPIDTTDSTVSIVEPSKAPAFQAFWGHDLVIECQPDVHYLEVLDINGCIIFRTPLHGRKEHRILVHTEHAVVMVRALTNDGTFTKKMARHR